MRPVGVSRSGSRRFGPVAEACESDADRCIAHHRLHLENEFIAGLLDRDALSHHVPEDAGQAPEFTSSIGPAVFDRHVVAQQAHAASLELTKRPKHHQRRQQNHHAARGSEGHADPHDLQPVRGRPARQNFGTSAAKDHPFRVQDACMGDDQRR